MAIETESGAPELRHDPSSGITYRVRPRTVPGAPACLLIHGFGGDENVLWVVQSVLPEGALIAAPRGLFSADGGGYAWVDSSLGPGGGLSDFDPARPALTRWVATLKDTEGLALDTTYLIGFSQGSALCFALSASGDLCPKGVAALAAYLPDGDLSGLEGLPIFWSHGAQDDRVPIERARRDVERLRDAGAAVDYCETDTGHKVGIECMRALHGWLNPKRR